MAEEIGGNHQLEIYLLDFMFSSLARGFTIDFENLIATLKNAGTTPSLTNITVGFDCYEATPEKNRLNIEPLCRCIANLRRHIQNLRREQNRL